MRNSLVVYAMPMQIYRINHLTPCLMSTCMPCSSCFLPRAAFADGVLAASRSVQVIPVWKSTVSGNAPLESQSPPLQATCSPAERARAARASGRPPFPALRRGKHCKVAPAALPREPMRGGEHASLQPGAACLLIMAREHAALVHGDDRYITSSHQHSQLTTQE